MKRAKVVLAVTVLVSGAAFSAAPGHAQLRPGAVPLPQPQRINLPKPTPLPSLPRATPLPNLTTTTQSVLSVQGQTSGTGVSTGLWLQQNQLWMPNATWNFGGSALAPGGYPAYLPGSYAGVPLLQVFAPNLWTLVAVYGTDPALPRYLAGIDTRNGLLRYAIDLRGLGGAQILRAQVVGDVLYVSYVRPGLLLSSGSLVAFDLSTGSLLWNSPDRIANANSFAVLGGYVVTGWGGANGPGYVYVLNRRNGRIVQRQALDSAPQYILPRGQSVYVRSRAKDYQFSLR